MGVGVVRIVLVCEWNRSVTDKLVALECALLDARVHLGLVELARNVERFVGLRRTVVNIRSHITRAGQQVRTKCPRRA